MRIGNEEPIGDGGWNDLVRLQSQYQARLAEETLRYLRGVQAAVTPRAPGTVVRPGGVRLTAEGAPGEDVELSVTVENRQRVHSTVAPALSPLSDEEGWTWYPQARVEPAAILLAPDETVTVRLMVRLPSGLPSGAFRGGLLLHGFLLDPVPVRIDVREVPA